MDAPWHISIVVCTQYLRCSDSPLILLVHTAYRSKLWQTCPDLQSAQFGWSISHSTIFPYILAPAALTQPRILREHYSSLAQPQTGFFSFFFLLILNNRTRLAINLFHRLLLMTPWSCMMCSIINVCLQYQVLEYSIVRPSCMHHQCNQSKVPS